MQFHNIGPIPLIPITPIERPHIDTYRHEIIGTNLTSYNLQQKVDELTQKYSDMSAKIDELNGFISVLQQQIIDMRKEMQEKKVKP